MCLWVRICFCGNACLANSKYLHFRISSKKSLPEPCCGENVPKRPPAETGEPTKGEQAQSSLRRAKARTGKKCHGGRGRMDSKNNAQRLGCAKAGTPKGNETPRKKLTKCKQLKRSRRNQTKKANMQPGFGCCRKSQKSAAFPEPAPGAIFGPFDGSTLCVPLVSFVSCGFACHLTCVPRACCALVALFALCCNGLELFFQFLFHVCCSVVSSFLLLCFTPCSLGSSLLFDFLLSICTRLLVQMYSCLKPTI